MLHLIATLAVVFILQNCEGLTESQLKIIPKKVNYETATCLCIEENMRLVKVEDKNTDQMVYNFANKNNLGRYWMDGNDKKETGKWVYNRGCKMTYTNWQQGEPNNPGVENCLEGARYPKGLWNNIVCDRENAVICYKDDSDDDII